MEKWSSNPRRFQSLLSAWHLAGWQEAFPSLREAPASCGACRPWLRLAPWPEAAVLVSCGTARLGMCIYVCSFFSELGLSKDCCRLSLLHQAAARSGEDPSPRLASGTEPKISI